MDRGLCRYCHQNPIDGRRRKYCHDHARNASAIWKRMHPEYRGDWNVTKEERLAYFRTYMREYRRRRRSRSAA